MPTGCTIPLSVEGLLAKAREITGIATIDTEVVEPLSVLLDSLDKESCLHEQGAIEMQTKLLRLLSNRLRMQRDFARHPEIADQEIIPPVLICGLPRTGSTKVQKLLAATGDFNWLPFWQTFNPSLFSGSREESPQARIREADAYCARFDAASPMTKVTHPFETYEPEEESFILEHTFVSGAFMGYSEVPSYLQWLAAQDQSQPFAYLRNALKYLQWQGLQSGVKPWVLKCPLNAGLQPILRQRFPAATLVMTHRDPKEILPSACSMLVGFHQPFTDAPMNFAAVSGAFRAQLDQHMLNREMQANLDLFDVSYAQVTREAPTIIEQIYRRVGLPFTERTRQSIRAWEAENAQHRKGTHAYSLHDFGFTEQQIDAEFGAYYRLLDQLFGTPRP